MKRILVLLIANLTFAAYALAQNPMPCNSNNCTTNAGIDVCPANSNNVVANFVNPVQKAGNPCGNGLCKGSTWRFANVATVSGQQINAEVRVDSIYQAILSSIDDNTNVNGVTTDLFAPRISPDISIPFNANRRGWVQFTVTFYLAVSGDGYSQQQPLSTLNFVNYDIDGSGNSNTWFREIASFRQNAGSPQIFADASTELNSDVYNEAGGNWPGTWAGFIGSVCERTGVSKCVQVAAAASFPSAAGNFTFRMGYDAKNGGNGIGQPVRQYGAKLGCFNFTTGIQLPVKFLSFGATYNNGTAILNWDVAQEIGIRAYEIERSTDGMNFARIGSKTAVNSGINIRNYSFSDNLTQINASVVYYRIKIVEEAGIFRYSNVVNVRIDKTFTGLMISPNPVISNAQVRFQLDKPAKGELTIIDASGKIVHRQAVNGLSGNNNIILSDLGKLNTGIYYVRLPIGDQVFYEKFVVRN